MNRQLRSALRSYPRIGPSELALDVTRHFQRVALASILHRRGTSILLIERNIKINRSSQSCNGRCRLHYPGLLTIRPRKSAISTQAHSPSNGAGNVDESVER